MQGRSQKFLIGEADLTMGHVPYHEMMHDAACSLEREMSWIIKDNI